MDQEELERVAGKQALLQHERRAVAAAYGAEKQKIIGIANTANSGVSQQWLDNSVAVLKRVFELYQQLQAMDQQIGEYRKLTGLD